LKQIKILTNHIQHYLKNTSLQKQKKDIDMNINSNVVFNYLTTFLSILVIATIINVVLYSILPKQGIYTKTENNNEIEFVNYESLYKNNKKLKIVKRTNQSNDNKSLKNMILKAIYSKSEMEGWIIVQKSASDTNSYIIEQGEKFSGFKLIRFYNDYVIFQKNSNEFKLKMKSEKNSNIYQMINNNLKNIIIDKNIVRIKRDYINKQIKDKNNILKTIMIKAKSSGIEIRKIEKNSFFEKLNLKERDIIQSVNNSKMNNYNQLLNLYNNMKNMDLLIVKIKRENKNMEIRYEIN